MSEEKTDIIKDRKNLNSLKIFIDSENSNKLIVIENGTQEEYKIKTDTIIKNLKTDKGIVDVKIKYIEVNGQRYGIIGDVLEDYVPDIFTDREKVPYPKIDANNSENFYRFIFLSDFTEFIVDSFPSIFNKFSFQNSIFVNAKFFVSFGQRVYNLKNCIFRNSICFKGEDYTSKADFSNSIFLEDVRFKNAKFRKNVAFSDCIFHKKLDLSLAKFDENVYFNRSIFKNKLDLSSVEIKNILFLPNEKMNKLDLKNSTIERLKCIDVKNINSDNRETFQILKGLLIKQSDNILALDSYTKEMEQHYQDLKWPKNPINKFLLGFERIISNFGTSPLHTIASLFVLHFFIGSFMYDCPKYIDSVYQSITDISPLKERFYNGWLILGKNILNYILIYELIKSFRKYSRKL